jgi:hypothetical protein
MNSYNLSVVTLFSGTSSLFGEKAMAALDAFSTAYAEFLQDQYDCVDRIILNAYFQMGCSPGGFRTWWRALYGNDDNLDNNHLMRLAGRFSRRVRGWAKSEGIPLIDCAAGERKHDLAEQYLPKAPSKTGIFLVLVNRAPFPVWDVVRNGRFMDLRRKKPAPYVNHYTFHIWDEQWGHVAIRICGHPPFSALVMLNGHELVTSGCQSKGIQFRKEGNCFTELADAPGLQHVADTLRSQDATGRLRQVCERWLYRCLCFALDSDEQKRTEFRYELSMFQLEYSRNFLFQRGRELEQIFQGLIDRTRATLDIKTIKTILGCKRRPQKRSKTRWEITVETPEYGLTIFKVHAGALTLKMYTKGERVLRCEIMLHNARLLNLGTSLPRWAEVIGHLRGVLERFVEVIQCADAATIDDGTFDALPQSSQVGRSKMAGLHITSSRLALVLSAVLAVATKPGGFSSGDLAEQVRKSGKDKDYQARHAAYDLKKLRGKKLVDKIGASRRYQAPAEGLRTMVALMMLRDKVLKPVLRNCNLQGPPPRTTNPVDHHYYNLRQEMWQLFRELKIAA